MGGDKGRSRHTISRQGAAAVKAEPAKPEQARTQHGHGQVVRLKVFTAIALAGTDNQDRCQCRCPAGDMNHQATGKVMHPHFTQPAAAAPYPVADRIIDQNRPEQTEEHKGPEADPFGKGAGNQRRRNNGEHALVDHEHGLRNGGCVIGTGRIGYPIQGKPGQVADKTADIRAKRHGIADINPFNRND